MYEELVKIKQLWIQLHIDWAGKVGDVARNVCIEYVPRGLMAVYSRRSGGVLFGFRGGPTGP